MDRFQFRKHLYLISNHLSTSEVDNLKFLCADELPRRQIDRVKTGFELFCLMEAKHYLSMTDTEFLGDLLDEVRKRHLIQPLLEQGGGRGQGVVEGRAPHVAPPLGSEYDVPKLKRAYKKLLVSISDELPENSVHDIALFFFDPKTPNLSLQDVERFHSATKLFQVLEDNGIIGPTDMQTLRAVLEMIGRKDLCQMIDDYMTKTKDFIRTPQGVGGSVQASDDANDYQSGQLSLMHSIVTQPSDISSPNTSLTSLSSGTLSTARVNDTSQLLSGFTDSSQQSVHRPTTMTGDHTSLQSPIVHGTVTHHLNRHSRTTGGVASSLGGHQNTRELSLTLDRKDDQIQQQEEKIQHLSLQLEKMEAVQESGHGDAHSLREQLDKMISEHRSLRHERERLREQLLKAEDAPLYTMMCSPHGIAVVIVNERFEPNPERPDLDLAQREGASIDSQRFQQTFEHLNYIVRVYKNLTSIGMCEVIDQTAKESHENFDSFVCCISTHGDEHVMYGSDSVGVKRAEFDHPLKQCPTLKGKPKMFFIQACRRTPLSLVQPDCPTTPVHPRIPLDRDVFIANATTIRQASFRSAEGGSWFVEALHGVLISQADYCNLVPMMYAVNTVVSSNQGFVVSPDESAPPEEVVQCAEWTTTFTKGVRFRRGMEPQQPPNLQ